MAVRRRSCAAWTARGGWPSARRSRSAEHAGPFSTGYTVRVLRNGRHAAVLLAPDGNADPAYFQPFLAPCDR